MKAKFFHVICVSSSDNAHFVGWTSINSALFVSLLVQTLLGRRIERGQLVLPGRNTSVFPCSIKSRWDVFIKIKSSSRGIQNRNAKCPVIVSLFFTSKSQLEFLKMLAMWESCIATKCCHLHCSVSLMFGQCQHTGRAHPVPRCLSRIFAPRFALKARRRRFLPPNLFVAL